MIADWGSVSPSVVVTSDDDWMSTVGGRSALDIGVAKVDSSSEGVGGEWEPEVSGGWDWGFAVGMAVVSVAISSFVSFPLPSLLGQHNAWRYPDWLWTAIKAQDLAHGHLSMIYVIQQGPSLPGIEALLAPLVAFAGHFGLSTGYPAFLQPPGQFHSIWLVVGPFFFVTGAASLVGVDYLARTLALPKSRRRAVAIAYAVIVVPPTCVYAGHPEDLVALGLCCIGLALLVQGRFYGASWILSAAVLMQPWSGLIIPLFIAYGPGVRRFGMVWRIVLPPLVTALALFIADPRDTSIALIRQPQFGNGQRLPWWSLPTHRTMVFTGYGSQHVLSGSEVRSAAVLVSLAAAVWVYQTATTRRLVSAVALVLFARVFFETQVWCWYIAPAAVLSAIVVGKATETSRRQWVAGSVSVLVMYSFVAGAYAEGSDYVDLPSWVALGVLLVTGFVVLRVSCSVPHRRELVPDCGLRPLPSMEVP